ncbi:MAG: RICIN domain-containing protein [Pseudomonadota bacterium]
MLRSLLLLFVTVAVSSAAIADTKDYGHLRLKDRLDRPVDGYCLDILGVGQALRLEVPVFAHNCKGGLTNDSAVELRKDGKIAFPAVDLCITAAGVNGRALPGAAILLRPCGHRAPFFESGALQTFDFKDDGRVVLKGSNLCLAVGEVSATTYSSADVWRVLSVEDCSKTATRLARWEFNKGPFPTN